MAILVKYGQCHANQPQDMSLSWFFCPNPEIESGYRLEHQIVAGFVGFSNSELYL